MSFTKNAKNAYKKTDNSNKEKKQQSFCNECSKNITADRIKVEGYCWDCCIKLGENAQGVFMKKLENNPELIEAFKEYQFNTGLRISAIILD